METTIATQNKKSFTARKNAANAKLHAIGLRYHDGIPTQEIQGILDEASMGRNAETLENVMDGIYCGSEGRMQEVVIDADAQGRFHKCGFFMSWYKMPSGRFEIVSCLS
jgi:hypothetical protein